MHFQEWKKYQRMLNLHIGESPEGGIGLFRQECQNNLIEFVRVYETVPDCVLY